MVNVVTTGPETERPLAGRVALVTGANHGIGAETALLLARAGAAVLATYLRAEDRAIEGLPRRYSHTRARDAGWIGDDTASRSPS